MLSLPERIGKYIERCEPAIAGQCGHNRTFAVACTLVWGFGLSVSQALPYALEYNRRCMPPWSKRDLQRKLSQALTHPGHTKPRGHLLGAVANYVPPSSEPLPKPEPAWPAPDLTAIERITSGEPLLSDLWEESPVKFEDSDSHAEEIIDTLFPGNPLLCVGKSSHQFATRRREDWRGQLARLPLIVPNPMLYMCDFTQDNNLSEHTKAATARRVYQVIEFDFAEQDKNGSDTIWTPLIRQWKAGEIEVVDACARLLLHLREHLPALSCVCFSGGKSLHSWFRVFELEPIKRREFMALAVSLGADKATWTRSQFVRIPDGLRENNCRQTCYYLDPREAVTA